MSNLPSLDVAAGGQEIERPSMLPRSSDEDLVALFLEGDGAAFESIVRRHEGTVRAILYRLVGNADDAEEMAQETFLRVYGGLARFKGRSELKTWILRIAANLARDHRRRKRRRPPPLSLEEAGPLPARGERARDPAERLAGKERTAAVAAAIEALPFKQRAALIMKVVADMSYDEIARVLATTKSTVRSHVHTARRRLMAMVGGRL